MLKTFLRGLRDALLSILCRLGASPSPLAGSVNGHHFRGRDWSLSFTKTVTTIPWYVLPMGPELRPGSVHLKWKKRRHRGAFALPLLSSWNPKSGIFCWFRWRATETGPEALVPEYWVLSVTDLFWWKSYRNVHSLIHFYFYRSSKVGPNLVINVFLFLFFYVFSLW